MTESQKPIAGNIVPSPQRGLMQQSTSLIERGLRDATNIENERRKKKQLFEKSAQFEAAVRYGITLLNPVPKSFAQFAPLFASGTESYFRDIFIPNLADIYRAARDHPSISPSLRAQMSRDNDIPTSLRDVSILAKSHRFTDEQLVALNKLEEATEEESLGTVFELGLHYAMTLIRPTCKPFDQFVSQFVFALEPEAKKKLVPWLVKLYRTARDDPSVSPIIRAQMTPDSDIPRDKHAIAILADSFDPTVAQLNALTELERVMKEHGYRRNYIAVRDSECESSD